MLPLTINRLVFFKIGFQKDIGYTGVSQRWLGEKSWTSAFQWALNECEISDINGAFPAMFYLP